MEKKKKHGWFNSSKRQSMQLGDDDDDDNKHLQYIYIYMGRNSGFDSIMTDRDMSRLKQRQKDVNRLRQIDR